LPASMLLGQRITESRENKAFTIKDAARRMGVTEKTIKRWESGKTQPRANKLQMLAGILGVPLLWLLDGEYQFDPIEKRPSRLGKLEQKFERVIALQTELANLSSEIAYEVEALRRIDDELESLAA